METHCTEGKFSFQDLGSRKVEAAFDGGTVTSDAGALLLRELERGTKYLKRFASNFRDYRDPSRIEHSVEELLAQRVYGLCLGYEDLNDHDFLRHDPLLGLLCGKLDPTGQNRRMERDRGAPLAGKSTLNRLELTEFGATGEQRYSKIVADEQGIGNFFIDLMLDAHKVPPSSICLDFDSTAMILHGQQEERHFHAHYREYCYLPLYVFCGDFILMSLLRPSYLDSAFQIDALLEPLLHRIRQRWPDVHILLRGDGGFCRDELMSFVEKRKEGGEKIDFLLGLPGNKRLLEAMEQPMNLAKSLFQETGKTSRVFTEFPYSTRESWSAARRVIGKAEHMEQGANPRFIVTSIPEQRSAAVALYEVEYCGRGDAENRIKEQQLGLFADRMSSSSFEANQLRLYFSALAYTLLKELSRLALCGTQLATAQCWSIREKLLKIGARVLFSARRLRLMMASGYPWQSLFATALNNLHATFEPLRI